MSIANKNKYVKGNTSDFKKSGGWFIGQFMSKWGHPELETQEVEVGLKILRKGDKDKLHYHKKGVEIAIVISGWFKASVNGEQVEAKERDFLIVYPQAQLELVDFIDGTEVIVVKAPSIPSDKFDV